MHHARRVGGPPSTNGPPLLSIVVLVPWEAQPMMVPPACAMVVYLVVMLEMTVKVPILPAMALWTVHTIPAAATAATVVRLVKDMPLPRFCARQLRR